MADQRAFSDHVEKLLFIKRLQARENSFNKFLTGDGILAEGGGMARGGGLGSGGGLDSSGFKNRRPAVQTAMLSNDKNEDDFIEANENLVELSNVEMVEYTGKGSVSSKAEESKAEETRVQARGEGKFKTITLSGVAKSVWEKSDIRSIQKISEHTIGDYDKFEHDVKDFTGTTSKAVIFEKDGVILKYKSISELSKAVGLSKYQILKGFKPKKNGDSFFHEKLKGTLTFVNRKDLQ
jgi:hypothetical protein